MRSVIAASVRRCKRCATVWHALCTETPGSMGDDDMMYYALVFLVVALIAGVLGFSGIAGTAANIAWILFVVGLVLAVVFFIRGRSI